MIKMIKNNKDVSPLKNIKQSQSLQAAMQPLGILVNSCYVPY